LGFVGNLWSYSLETKKKLNFDASSLFGSVLIGKKDR